MRLMLMTLRHGAHNLSLPIVWGVLAVITLLWTAHQRDAFPFWADEAYTVLQVRAKDLHELLHINLRTEETPPLYFVLLRLWAFLWGDSGEATLRLFSACSLAAAVPFVGWLGQQLGGHRGGIWAATLLAVNPFAHYYAQETRAYAFALFLTSMMLVATYCYVHQPSWRTWLWYVVSSTAALYTSYFAAFAVLGCGLIGWLLPASSPIEGPSIGRTRRAWIGAHLLILLLLLPWLPAMVYQYHLLGSWVATPTPPQQLWIRLTWRPPVSLVVLFTHPPITTSGLLYWLPKALFVAVCVVAGVQLLRRGDRRLWLWFVGSMVVPLLTLVYVFRNTDYYTYRYALSLLPACILFIVTGVTHVRHRAWWSWALLGTLVIASVITASTPPRRQSGWKEVARIVEQQAQRDDHLFFVPPWTGPAFRVQYRGLPLAHGVASFAQYDDHSTSPDEVGALERVLRNGRRAWIVWDRTWQPQLPQVPGGTQYQEHHFGSTSLFLLTPQESISALQQ